MIAAQPRLFTLLPPFRALLALRFPCTSRVIFPQGSLSIWEDITHTLSTLSTLEEAEKLFTKPCSYPARYSSSRNTGTSARPSQPCKDSPAQPGGTAYGTPPSH